MEHFGRPPHYLKPGASYFCKAIEWLHDALPCVMLTTHFQGSSSGCFRAGGEQALAQISWLPTLPSESVSSESQGGKKPKNGQSTPLKISTEPQQCPIFRRMTSLRFHPNFRPAFQPQTGFLISISIYGLCVPAKLPRLSSDQMCRPKPRCRARQQWPVGSKQLGSQAANPQTMETNQTRKRDHASVPICIPLVITSIR